MLEAAARPLQFPDRTHTKQPRKRPTETSRRMRRLLYTAFTLVNLNYETFCPPFVLPSETRRKRLLLLNNFPSFLCYLYSFAPGKKLESENIFFVAALFFLLPPPFSLTNLIQPHKWPVMICSIFPLK